MAFSYFIISNHVKNNDKNIPALELNQKPTLQESNNEMAPFQTQ